MGKKALKTKSSQNGAKNTENVSNDILLALPYLLLIGFNLCNYTSSLFHKRDGFFASPKKKA